MATVEEQEEEEEEEEEEVVKEEEMSENDDNEQTEATVTPEVSAVPHLQFNCNHETRAYAIINNRKNHDTMKILSYTAFGFLCILTLLWFSIFTSST